MNIRNYSTGWMTLLFALLWTLNIVSRCLADSWGPPEPEHWSANRHFVLKVDDRKSRLTLRRSEAGSPPVWSIPYPQTWAPKSAYITDDGRYVVLQDQHGNVGYGKVFLFLGPSGAILKAYNLEQLLTQSERLESPESVSSIYWDAYSQSFFTAHQTCFACVTQRGTIRCFELATGKRLDGDPDVRQRVRIEAILRARNWLTSTDHYDRTTGITQVGALGDRASLPTLTSLLNFHTVAGNKKKENASIEEDRSIQYFAASALVALLKAKAAALLEAHLDITAPDWTPSWLELYSKTGRARFSPKIDRLAHSRDNAIRIAAIEALLEGGNPAAVRRNHAWLMDKFNERVRWLAAYNLSEYGGKEDLPLLRIALRDKDDSCELWALRGLIRLNARELPRLLQHYVRSGKDSSARQEALLELARRGDRTQLESMIASVRTLGTRSHRHTVWDDMYIADVCHVLALQQPVGAVAALRAAAKNRDEEIERPTIGALAAIGDVHALIRLRRFAQTGDAIHRADAIGWLEACKDHNSEKLLKAAKNDEDPLVRDAAAEALRTLHIGGLRGL